MTEKPLPLPSSSNPRAAAYTVAFVVYTIAVVSALQSSNTLVTVPVLIAGMLLFAFFYYRRRCPECGNVPRYRRDYFPNSTVFRCLHECRQCGIAWVRPDIGDDSQSG